MDSCADELGLVGENRKQHPDGDLAAQREVGADRHEGDLLEHDHRLAKRDEHREHTLLVGAAVHCIGHAGDELRLARALGVEQFDCLHRANALDEMRHVVRFGANDILAAPIQRRIEADPQRRVDCERAERDECQRPAHHEHQHQRCDREDAVDHGEQHALGEQLANWVQGVEARDDVAVIALDEE